MNEWLFVWAVFSTALLILVLAKFAGDRDHK